MKKPLGRSVLAFAAFVVSGVLLPAHPIGPSREDFHTGATIDVSGFDGGAMPVPAPAPLADGRVNLPSFDTFTLRPPGLATARLAASAVPLALRTRRREVTIHLGCDFFIHERNDIPSDLSYDGRMYNPANQQIAYGQNWVSQNASIYASLLATLTDPEEGTYKCEVNWYVYDVFLGTSVDTAQATYRIPSGETTWGNAWSGVYPSVYKWRATLTGGSFNGRRVEEYDGGRTTGDTCWYPGSAISKFEAITGFHWDIQSNNTYADDDLIGWLPGAVSHYRQFGPNMPCMTDFYQDMKINRPGSSYALYKTNWLKAGMETSSVWSERDGHAVSKPY